MRFVLFVLLVGGCGSNTDDIAAKASAAVASCAQVKAEDEGMKMELAALRMELAMLRMDTTVSKIGAVHLYVRTTGEDLGPFIGWDAAWAPDIQTPEGRHGTFYRISSRSLVVFSGINCDGEARLSDPGPYGYTVASTGTIIHAVSGPSDFIANSFLEGECYGYKMPQMLSVAKMSDTKIIARLYDRADLEAR